MNRQDVANLTLRIVGLYAIMIALGMLAMVLNVASESTKVSWFMIGVVSAEFLIILIFGLLMLLAAPRIARRIFPTAEHTGDPARILGLHAFAYSIVGIFIAIRGLSGLAGCAPLYLFDRRYQMQSWPKIVCDIAPSSVDLIVGIALFLGSHGLVRIWSHLRSGGLRRKMNLCVHCCYDLTGNASGVCPECGTPIDRPQQLSVN